MWSTQVPVLQILEPVPNLATSDDAAAAARTFVEEVLGRRVVLSRSWTGLAVTALPIAFLPSAVRMTEFGRGHAKRGPFSSVAGREETT